MSLTYKQLLHAPGMIAQRAAELLAERSWTGTGMPCISRGEIARVRHIVGKPTWHAIVNHSPDLTMAQVDAVALALGTTAEWLMGSNTAPRSRPSLEVELVAGMAKHDLCEADVAAVLGISRELLERTAASPHLVSPLLVNSLRQVLA